MTHSLTGRVLSVVLLCVLSSCSKGPQSESQRRGEARVFNYSFRPTELQELEYQVVAEGHQPWRLDVAWIARASLADVLVSAFGCHPDKTAELIGGDEALVVKSDGKGRRTAVWRHGDMVVEMSLLNSKAINENGVWYCDKARVYGAPVPAENSILAPGKAWERGKRK